MWQNRSKAYLHPSTTGWKAAVIACIILSASQSQRSSKADFICPFSKSQAFLARLGTCVDPWSGSRMTSLVKDWATERELLNCAWNLGNKKENQTVFSDVKHLCTFCLFTYFFCLQTCNCVSSEFILNCSYLFIFVVESTFVSYHSTLFNCLTS